MLKRGGVGEYYGIQGTAWQDGRLNPKNPPILEGPRTARTVNGKKFDVYYDGDRVRLVAWRNAEAVYWLSNTLLETLSAKEMLKIAGNTAAREALRLLAEARAGRGLGAQRGRRRIGGHGTSAAPRDRRRLR